MRQVAIHRGPSTDQGTFGTLVTDSGFNCRTGELPWRDNQPNLSCVRKGVYPCVWRYSVAHQRSCYHVEGVPERTGVEIHVANFCGDVVKKFNSQLLGCIALGFRVGLLGGQQALLRSESALLAFESDLKTEPFELTIS